MMFASLKPPLSHKQHHKFCSRTELPNKIPSNWPIIPHELKPSNIKPQRRLYYQLVVVITLLKAVSPKSVWKNKFLALMKEFPTVAYTGMGFPENWDSETFWKPIPISEIAGASHES
jgi:hypothetical protein